MTKFILIHDYGRDIEDAVNKWLERNPGVKILHLSCYNASGSLAHYVGILYKETKKKGKDKKRWVKPT